MESAGLFDFVVDGEAGRAHPRRSEFLVEPGDRFAFAGALGRLGDAIALLKPGAETKRCLDEVLEDLSRDDVEWRIAPEGLDVEVDGTAWGWLYVLDQWWFVPLRFQEEASDVLAFQMNQTESMTGMTVEAGCRVLPPAAMSWLYDDIDGIRWFDVSYGATDLVLAAGVMARVFGDSERGCVEEDDGWEVEFSLSRDVPLEVVGAGLARAWGPCEEHPAGWAAEIGGHAWVWREGTWLPAPGGKPSS